MKRNNPWNGDHAMTAESAVIITKAPGLSTKHGSVASPQGGKVALFHSPRYYLLTAISVRHGTASEKNV
jgi:hypothetical protein